MTEDERRRKFMDWFDVDSYEHVSAWEIAFQLGIWPTEFQAKMRAAGVEPINPGEVTGKVARAWAKALLSRHMVCQTCRGLLIVPSMCEDCTYQAMLDYQRKNGL